jgi:limonene-1,2-epoxide hydrolase
VQERKAELEADNVRIVDAFLNAVQDEDFDTMTALLDETLRYENVGLPTIHGGRRTVDLFKRMQGRFSFEVRIHRIAAVDAVVLTERTDAFVAGPLRVQFWACGVFEVHDGRITLWRDYMDVFDIAKAMVRAVAGAVFPSLRPTLDMRIPNSTIPGADSSTPSSQCRTRLVWPDRRRRTLVSDCRVYGSLATRRTCRRRSQRKSTTPSDGRGGRIAVRRRSDVGDRSESG